MFVCWEQIYADGQSDGNGWVVGLLRRGRMMYQGQARDYANIGRTIDDGLFPRFADFNANNLACR